MHLCDCENPIRVYSKVLGEYVWTRCGKCNSCKKYRASRWIARLETERSFHPFAAFVTLTYSDSYLPRFKFLQLDNCFRLESYRNGSYRCILSSEIDLSAPLEKEYFDKRIASFDGMPYADFSDIQLYHKRLNKAIHDKITHKWSNFRFWTVSEYGSTCHRPHFHEILFFDDPKIASELQALVDSSWNYKRNAKSSFYSGITDCQIIEKSACSYVAQYVNQLFDLPSFYDHCELRPRFICSKRPSIGSGGYNSEVLQQIFDSESPTTVIPDSQTNGFKVVPLLPCIKNRLFPRIAFFKSLSHSLRVKLYGIAVNGFFEFWNFETFCRFIPSVLKHQGEDGLQAFDYINRNDSPLGKVPHAFLRRLYYISKRVIQLCRTLNLSVHAYVCKIERFYDNCEISSLRSFYTFQEEYCKDHSFESLIHMYPEYKFQNAVDGCIKLEYCEDYLHMVKDSAVIFSKMTKTHFKNAYLDSVVEVNDFFNFLKFVWYAQKCNEDYKAFPEFSSE